jgi:hypothetical protein
MDGAEKLKIALDETRMLVLGAEVLLGFQLRGSFEDGFDNLPPSSKALLAAALLLMTAVLGLLMAPAIYHRTVHEGNATASIFSSISAFMTATLIPFAISLGLNVFIVVEQIVYPVGGLLAGVAVMALALWFWFGMELWTLRSKGGKSMNMKDEHVPVLKKIDQMLTEARVILPGAQVLLGFQLSVVITQGFDKLPSSSKAIHALALGLVTLSIILLMAPAAYHRIVYAGEASQEFLALGSRFLMAATTALALGLAADIYVVITKIAESRIVGTASAVTSLMLLLGLWHIAPAVLVFRGAPERFSARDAEGQRL